MDILSFVIVHRQLSFRMTLCDSRLRVPAFMTSASVVPSESDVRTLLGKIEDVVSALKAMQKELDIFPAYILSETKGVGDYCIHPATKKAEHIDRPARVMVHRWSGSDYPKGYTRVPTDRMFEMFDTWWCYDMGLPKPGFFCRPGYITPSQLIQVHRLLSWCLDSAPAPMSQLSALEKLGFSNQSLPEEKS